MQDKNYMYKEVLTVLSCFKDEIIQKIPTSVFAKLIDLAADCDAKVYIDMEKDIDSQNISEESKDIISLIYYCCMADEHEKSELQNIWKQNENK